MDKFGDRLRSLRIGAELTQSELGSLVGLSKQAISKMENNMNKYSNNELVKRLAFHLKCTPDYLLGLSDERNRTEKNKLQVISIDPDADEKKQIEELFITDSEYLRLILELHQKFDKKEIKKFKRIIRILLEDK